MVFTRQKSRAGANPESPPRTQPGKNIREERTPRRTVFTREDNELFIQKGSSILSGSEGWLIALSCSWFEIVLNRE